MADDGAHGSTLSFNSATVGDVVDIEYSDGGADIDVTDLNSSTKEYIAGTKDPRITATVIGRTALTDGATGALSITWNDGGSDSISKAKVKIRSVRGAEGGRIESQLEFVPTP